MQETINKIKTYLGFAIKSGKLIYGVDNINKKQKKVFLILLCNTISSKTEKNICLLNIKTFKVLGITLSEILEKENVKAVGISDRNLSEAILQNSSLFEKLI